MGFWGDQWNTVSGGATAGAYGLGQGLLDGRIGDIINMFMDQDIYEIGQRMNHVLEERSYLEFYFPLKGVGGGVRNNVRRVPFFQNPILKESRSPSYAKTQIVQRNEPARLYVGSDVRKLSLQFSMLFPHVMDFMKLANDGRNLGPGWNGDRPTAYQSYVSQQAALNATGSRTSTTGLVEVEGAKMDSFAMNVTWTPDPSRGPRMNMDSLPAGGSKTNQGPTKFTGVVGGQAGGEMVNPVAPSLASMYDFDATNPGVIVAAFITYVLDTIKASVLGTQGPALASGRQSSGPPLVRFRHGTVFVEEPWIVTGYTINYDDRAGMDPRTLLPRKTDISLQLESFHQVESFEGIPGAAEVMNLNSFARGSNGRHSPTPGSSQPMMDIGNTVYKPAVSQDKGLGDWWSNAWDKAGDLF